MVVDKHATSLIAAVQRGLEVGAAFRASPAGVTFPGPFDSANAPGASAGEDVDASALYQPALHRYFESTLPGALKPTVVPAAAAATAPVSSPHVPVALAGLQRLWTETKSQKLSIPVALMCVDGQPNAAADPNAAVVSSSTTADEDATGASYRSKSWQRNVIGDDLDKIKSGAAALVRSWCHVLLFCCDRVCAGPANTLTVLSHIRRGTPLAEVEPFYQQLGAR